LPAQNLHSYRLLFLILTYGRPCPGNLIKIASDGESNIDLSQLIQEVRRNNLRPTEVLFVKGHAAWVPGQLTREIEKGVWYVAAASADLILRYAGAPVLKDDNPSDLWADILSCMGDKFVNIATAHSGRGDERMLP